MNQGEGLHQKEGEAWHLSVVKLVATQMAPLCRHLCLDRTEVRSVCKL